MKNVLFGTFEKGDLWVLRHVPVPTSPSVHDRMKEDTGASSLSERGRKRLNWDLTLKPDKLWRE